MNKQVTGNPQLVEFIGSQIRSGGPVTFRWFMEQALYHPEHGYYASGVAAPGKEGDFFTSVSVGPVFGKLLGIQFREMWERMGRPGRFTIVEQGANNGDFARDVLGALQADAADFAGAVEYVIVEPFPVLRKRQQEKLTAFPQVEWRGGLEELEPFQGVHFSNELADAMPVHLVRFAGGEWKERFVDWRDDGFEWMDGPVSSEKLRRHLEKLPANPGENYITEINLDALEWMEALSPRLSAGYVLIADYGYPRTVYYESGRNTGTLACYFKHQRGDDPLQNTGLADITAHVEFTSLAESAEAHGLRVAGFADQHHFMVGLGKEAFPDTGEAPDADKQKLLRAFSTLMHPNLMGMHFKFLALEKNVPGNLTTPLGSFQFSQEPQAMLGLKGGGR